MPMERIHRVLRVQTWAEVSWRRGCGFVGVGGQGKVREGSAKGMVAVELRHLCCAAGALAQRVNRGSGLSPSTPTRGSARPAAGDAKSTASGASTGERSTCMFCCTRLACWQPRCVSRVCYHLTLSAPKIGRAAQHASRGRGARQSARWVTVKRPFSATPSSGMCCSVHGAA